MDSSITRHRKCQDNLLSQIMCLKDKAILYIEYLNPISTNSPDINMSLKKCTLVMLCFSHNV